MSGSFGTSPGQVQHSLAITLVLHYRFGRLPEDLVPGAPGRMHGFSPSARGVKKAELDYPRSVFQWGQVKVSGGLSWDLVSFKGVGMMISVV